MVGIVRDDQDGSNRKELPSAKSTVVGISQILTRNPAPTGAQSAITGI